MKRIAIIVFLFLSSSAYAGDVVAIARSQIGRGEIGGNNRGPVVKEYTQGKEVAWCAAFVSWAIHKAHGRGPYLLSARAYLHHYRKVQNPKAGDIICFSRGRSAGHVGIIERVDGNIITTIEGNVGKYPAKVKRLTYKIGRIPNLLGFVRL